MQIAIVPGWLLQDMKLLAVLILLGWIVLFILAARDFLMTYEVNPEVWERGFSLRSTRFQYRQGLGPLLDAFGKDHAVRFRQCGSGQINFYVRWRWYHVLRGFPYARAQMILHSEQVEVRSHLPWASVGLVIFAPGSFALLLAIGRSSGICHHECGLFQILALCGVSAGATVFTRRREWVLVQDAVRRARMYRRKVEVPHRG